MDEWKDVLTGTRRWSLTQGDCVEVMRAMPEACVDAIVTDPPYGLEFMGKTWDKLGASVSRDPVEEGGFQDGRGGNAYSRSRIRFGTTAQSMQAWHLGWAKAALHVLKPGGHMLSFGGTRTYHRMVCAIEDAGFEIRDTFSWVYSTGFPKDLNVSKGIDKYFGKYDEREIVGRKPDPRWLGSNESNKEKKPYEGGWGAVEADNPAGFVTKAATPEGTRWQGWGTALKPAHEPIVVARKPLIGTVVENVLEHGTGALNVDACRVAGMARSPGGGIHPHRGIYPGWPVDDELVPPPDPHPMGRWPPNLLLVHAPGCRKMGTKTVSANAHYPEYEPGTTAISSHGIYGGGDGLHGKQLYQEGERVKEEEVDEWSCVPGCPVAELGRQSGNLKSGSAGPNGHVRNQPTGNIVYGGGEGLFTSPGPAGELYGDEGTAARFFPQFEWSEADYGFFYVPKASRSEREEGTDGLPVVTGHEAVNRKEGSAGLQDPRAGAGRTARTLHNHHPCVKPISLAQWLVRLITPKGGIVLDPFSGSGSIGIGALREKFRVINIEQSEEYCTIARARLGSQDDSPPVDEVY